jgi:hypothetical protein
MHIGDVIEDLIFAYATKTEGKPGAFEVLAIKNALPHVAGSMDENTYKSHVEWVARHEKELEEEFAE